MKVSLKVHFLYKRQANIFVPPPFRIASIHTIAMQQPEDELFVGFEIQNTSPHLSRAISFAMEPPTGDYCLCKIETKFYLEEGAWVTLYERLTATAMQNHFSTQLVLFGKRKMDMRMCVREVWRKLFYAALAYTAQSFTEQLRLIVLWHTRGSSW